MIRKAAIEKIIEDEQDKIKLIRKAKGFGIFPDEVECTFAIETCKRILSLDAKTNG